MLLKVCGMNDRKNVAEIAALRPDYLGFIFFQRSPRCVTRAGRCAPGDVPEDIKKVGVFVNADLEEIAAAQERWNFDIFQLHGDESPDECSKLKQRFPDVKVMKAFQVGESFSTEAVQPFGDCCDLALFDTASVGYGGSGKTFAHELLAGCGEILPFFLSGGMGPETLPGVFQLAMEQPQLLGRCVGVDINSAVEIEPGVKDPVRVRRVIELLKESQQGGRKI